MLARRGAEEAGAIFIIVDLLNGAADLYGPAPQSLFVEEGGPTDRLFQRLVAAQPLPEIDARLDREIRFDPDLWIVTVEDRAGRVFFETA
jgi:hypothetical protein